MIAINLKNWIFFKIPLSNGCVERVFSILGNIWREECNRLLPEYVKAELQIKINYYLNCDEFYHSIKQNNKLLALCISKKKYAF